MWLFSLALKALVLSPAHEKEYALKYLAKGHINAMVNSIVLKMVSSVQNKWAPSKQSPNLINPCGYSKICR